MSDPGSASFDRFSGMSPVTTPMNIELRSHAELRGGVDYTSISRESDGVIPPGLMQPQPRTQSAFVGVGDGQVLLEELHVQLQDCLKAVDETSVPVATPPPRSVILTEHVAHDERIRSPIQGELDLVDHVVTSRREHGVYPPSIDLLATNFDDDSLLDGGDHFDWGNARRSSSQIALPRVLEPQGPSGGPVRGGEREVVVLYRWRPLLRKACCALLPFSILLPFMTVAGILVVYHYAPVNLCGGFCACNVRDAAVFFFSYGLIRNLFTTLFIVCLLEISIAQQQEIASVENNAGEHATRAEETTREGERGGGETTSSAPLSLPAPPPPPQRPVAVHRWSIPPLSRLLRTPSALALTVSLMGLQTLMFIVAGVFPVPEAMAGAILVARVIPCAVYAVWRKSWRASIVVLAVMNMPLLFQLATFRTNPTCHFPLPRVISWPFAMLVADRLYYALFAVCDAKKFFPSVEMKVTVATVHSFYWQMLVVGIGLLARTDGGVALALYIFQMIAYEILLGTVLIDRAVVALAACVIHKCFHNDTFRPSPVHPTDFRSIAAQTRPATHLIVLMAAVPMLGLSLWSLPPTSCEGRRYIRADRWALVAVVAAIAAAVAATAGLRRWMRRLRFPLFVHGRALGFLASMFLLMAAPEALDVLQRC